MNAEDVRALKEAIPLLERVVRGSDAGRGNDALDDSTILVKVFDKTLACEWKGIGECNRCGAQIMWVKTPKGKNMPLDPNANPDGIYTSHFGMCRAK